MASRIKILPEDLVNKIAAGEVIERPASVIKELVENSIDAQAKSLFIEVKESGKNLIQVVDDGEGMERDDALLAFERHGTSKIRSVEDLYAISSLGFRGEALPSIASVSRIKLKTCSNKEGIGVYIELEGGRIKRVEEIGFPQGTTLEVRSLFYNTPARLKFLKTDSTELSHICQIVTQQALARPAISFKLTHGQRSLIHLPVTNDYFPRLVSLFGLDFSRSLIPMDISQASLLQATGFISPPSFQHSSRRYQYIYLNNRFVRSKIIQQCLSDAYNTYLPKEKYPAVFLFITMDPTLVDCNAHPAKIEVRLRREKEIYSFLLEGLRKTLWDQNKKGVGLPKMSIPSDYTTTELKATHGSLKKSESLSPTGKNGDRKAAPQTLPQTLPGQLLPSSSFNWQDPWIAIGQIQNSFVLIETRNTVLVIDQHGAHERIIFEELRQNLSKNNKGQQLLIRESLSLTKAEALLLEHHLKDFEKLGFLLEPFGENSFIVRTVPAILVGKDYKQVLRDILDKLAETGKLRSLGESIERMMMVIACHAAVKAHDPLKPREIETLIRQLRELGPSHTCPHGRPIIQSLPIEEIKKKFMRHN